MYTPSQKILEKYANVLVNFALGGGKGIKKGEVVFLQVPESAKPLLKALRITVFKAGGNPIINYIPDDFSRDFFDYANDEQIKFFPTKYLKGKIDEMDHVISIIAEVNKYELRGVDPKKIMLNGLSMKPYMDWRNEKENKGRLTWTLAMYATNAMAKNAGMSLRKYWEEIIKGCYLKEEDPINKWKQTFAEIERIKTKLNSLDIQKLRIHAKDTDLIIGIDKNRKWLGGDGRNIPSFEIFISPNYYQTEGFISFSEPLYRYGNVVKNIKLKFKNGSVIESEASEGREILKEMIRTKGADKVGEFSLTDIRFSKITRFMGETLFDENMGGKYGNTHIALGSAYKDSYPGNSGEVKREAWNKMGYNDSSVHTDIISTTNRTIIATLFNGQDILIYKNGQFTL